MSPEPIVAGLLCAVLALYVLTGGADFGGGLWDLLARGPRQIRQRRAIAIAIGPIWEANHVWLIVAIVITFVCFPASFAAIGTALHVPLSLMLIGIVIRGTSFVFRSYDSRDFEVQRRWSFLFASASACTPVLLGVVVGSIASGKIVVEKGQVVGGFFHAWIQPFPWAVGLLTLAIFAFLAAVYMTVKTHDDVELQEDFRRNGLFAAGAVFCLAWFAFFLSKSGAPTVWNGLWDAPLSIPFQVWVGTIGIGCIGSLYFRWYIWARRLAAFQVLLVIAGWAFSQWPYVVPPNLTVFDAAPPNVLWLVIAVLLTGALPLIPAYAWLLYVFRDGSDSSSH